MAHFTWAIHGHEHRRFRLWMARAGRAMTIAVDRQNLRPQQRREGAAKGDFPFCHGQRHFHSGEQGRQFGVAPGAMGARGSAVAAMLEAIAIARLPAPFAGGHSNRAKFATPSRPGGRLDP